MLRVTYSFGPQDELHCDFPHAGMAAIPREGDLVEFPEDYGVWGGDNDPWYFEQVFNVHKVVHTIVTNSDLMDSPDEEELYFYTQRVLVYLIPTAEATVYPVVPDKPQATLEPEDPTIKTPPPVISCPNCDKFEFAMISGKKGDYLYRCNHCNHEEVR